MKNVQILDPAMCCSSGVCGTEVDQALVEFAVDVDWLRKQGVTVERFNLAQQEMLLTGLPPEVRHEIHRATACVPVLHGEGRGR